MKDYKYIFNWYRAWIGIWFFIIMNTYFGWNRWPESPEELICDGIVLAIGAMAWQKEKQE